MSGKFELKTKRKNSHPVLLFCESTHAFAHSCTLPVRWVIPNLDFMLGCLSHSRRAQILVSRFIISSFHWQSCAVPAFICAHHSPIDSQHTHTARRSEHPRMCPIMCPSVPLGVPFAHCFAHCLVFNSLCLTISLCRCGFWLGVSLCVPSNNSAHQTCSKTWSEESPFLIADVQIDWTTTIESKVAATLWSNFGLVSNDRIFSFLSFFAEPTALANFNFEFIRPNQKVWMKLFFNHLKSISDWLIDWPASRNKLQSEFDCFWLIYTSRGKHEQTCIKWLMKTTSWRETSLSQFSNEKRMEKNGLRSCPADCLTDSHLLPTLFLDNEAFGFDRYSIFFLLNHCKWFSPLHALAIKLHSNLCLWVRPLPTTIRKVVRLFSGNEFIASQDRNHPAVSLRTQLGRLFLQRPNWCWPLMKSPTKFNLLLIVIIWNFSRFPPTFITHRVVFEGFLRVSTVSSRPLVWRLKQKSQVWAWDFFWGHLLKHLIN